MIIDVVAVYKVQASIMQIVEVIAVLNARMGAAFNTVRVAVFVNMGDDFLGHWVHRADGDDMFIDMVTMNIVQVAIMEVVYMAIMVDRNMTVIGRVCFSVIGVDHFVGACRTCDEQARGE
ncbi:MAG: hypothetical protein AAF583_14025 [Pseudomonadota bacterium]